MVLNVIPTVPEFDLGDYGWGHAVLLRQLQLESFAVRMRKQISYFKHLCFGQFRSSVQCAVSDKLSSLGNHVPNIISKASNKQMVWVHARRIVAFVQHAHTIFAYLNALAVRALWKCKVRQFPRNSMSAFRFTISPDLPVAVSECCSEPQPAATARVFPDSLPESFHKRPFEVSPKGLERVLVGHSDHAT